MKKIIAIMLCLLMSICSAPAESTLPPVAVFDGGSIGYEEAYAEFESTLRAYSDFGWAADPGDMEEAAMKVLRRLVEEAVLYGKAQELGLNVVPQDELARLTESAQAQFEDQIAYYIDFYTVDGMTDEDARAATIAALEEDGITTQSLLDVMLEDWWYSALYEHVCADVVIDETHILAYAESLADRQAQDWAEDPLNFDYLYMNDDLIAWYPEGARYIRHILIGFDPEQADACQAVTDGGPLADADPAALDAVFAPLEPTVAEVQRRLNDGEDFDALMRTFGSDDFMLYEPYSVTGYIVQPGSQLFVNEFVDACFALENVGDISGPVRSAGGVHFILYAGDVPSGNVPLENIAEQVAAEAQDQLVSDTFNAQVAAWLEEAQPVYYPEYLLQ